MLVKYIRNNHGHRIGAVVALSATEIGWSLCNTKMGDIFDSYRAIEIAVGRAKKYRYDSIKIVRKMPRSCDDDFDNMVDRAKRYFQKK